MSMYVEQARESSLMQCGNGLNETVRQSRALQDLGYMIWAPEEGELIPGTSSNGVAAPQAKSGSRTLVWWDTETCPVPASTECDGGWDGMAHRLVRLLALPDMNRQCELVTCIAYGAGEVPEPLILALNRHGIVVHRRNLPACTLPGTGTTLSMKSMIVDLLFWALNNAPPAKVRIISATNEPNFAKLVRGLHRRCYDVVLASSLTGSITHGAAMGINREYFGQLNSNISDYWQSFLQQVTPEADESTYSLEQLQLLHRCLVSEADALTPPRETQRQSEYWTSMAHDLQVSPSRPTYKDMASGGEVSNRFSSLWNGESKTGALEPVRSASMGDVRGWLESFVEVEDSLFGMNISLMAKSFDRRGMKLDLKHLGCPSLSRLLLDNFSDIVRLKYPSKDCTLMFPAKLGAQAKGKLITDFTDLLADLLPVRNSESPMSLLKTAFRARFHYDLDHEAVGFTKLSQFLSSMPKLVRVRQCSSQGKELVICRPSVYYSKQRT